MTIIANVVRVFLFGVLALNMGWVSGQDYPNKTIRVIAAPAGGGADFAARIITQGLSARLGQPIIVEGRTPIIQGGILSKATPDGYTLLIGGEPLWIGPLLQKMPYDAVRDLAPVTLALSSPNVLAVNPSMPIKSVRDLIDLAKAKNGELNYGSSSTAGSGHLAGELFMSMAKVRMVRIGHKGTGDLIISMLNGQVQLAFVTITNITPHIKSGKLRGVAVTSAQPSALVPGLPTVAETLPGYKFVGDVALLAPPKTPMAIINRLNRETVAFLKTPEVGERFLNSGFEVVGSSPAELTAWIKSETAKWTKIIKEADIRLE